MFSAVTPSIDLTGFRHLVFAYDIEDDILYAHINGPLAADTEQVDDAWYLRVEGDEVVGLEIHGLKRTLLSTRFFSKMFKPALIEVEEFTGVSYRQASFDAEGTVEQLPHTAQLVVFLIGRAIEKYETMRQAEYQEAARRLLAG